MALLKMIYIVLIGPLKVMPPDNDLCNDIVDDEMSTMEFNDCDDIVIDDIIA